MRRLRAFAWSPGSSETFPLQHPQSTCAPLARPKMTAFVDLPQELVDRIVDNLPAYRNRTRSVDRTLENCALVCHAFLPRCQRWIFRWILIEGTRKGREFELLRSLLLTSPHLGAYVRFVTIIIQHWRRTPPEAPSAFSLLLKTCRNVVGLETIRLDITQPWIAECIRHEHGFPSLATLAIFHGRRPTHYSHLGALMHNFPKLSTLILQPATLAASPSFLGAEPPRNAPTVPSPSENNMLSRHLINLQPIWEDHPDVSVEINVDGVLKLELPNAAVPMTAGMSLQLPRWGISNKQVFIFRTT